MRRIAVKTDEIIVVAYYSLNDNNINECKRLTFKSGRLQEERTQHLIPKENESSNKILTNRILSLQLSATYVDYSGSHGSEVAHFRIDKVLVGEGISKGTSVVTDI